MTEAGVHAPHSCLTKHEIAHSTPTRAKHGHIGDHFGWVLQLPELGQSRRPDISAASRPTTNTIDGHLAGHLPYRRPRCWPFANHFVGFPTGHLAGRIAGSATLAICKPFCWPAHGPSRKPPWARGCPHLLVVLTSWEWAGSRARRNLDLLHSGARPDSQARFL